MQTFSSRIWTCLFPTTITIRQLASQLYIYIYIYKNNKIDRMVDRLIDMNQVNDIVNVFQRLFPMYVPLPQRSCPSRLLIVLWANATFIDGHGSFSLLFISPWHSQPRRFPPATSDNWIINTRFCCDLPLMFCIPSTLTPAQIITIIPLAGVYFYDPLLLRAGVSTRCNS